MGGGVGLDPLWGKGRFGSAMGEVGLGRLWGEG